MHDDYDRIARAIRFLDTHLEDQPRLAEIADHLELSEHHFHRLFHQWVGVTPKDFLQQLTLVKARTLLAREASLLDTSLELGLSGTSRLHDLFTALERMTPGEYKARARGVAIAWGLHPTPLGPILVATTDRGVCGLSFVETDQEEAVADLAERWPGASLHEDLAATAPVADEVCRRLAGAPAKPLALCLKGTPFQIKVWEALLAIPEGQVTTYQGLARLAGTPGASRAVGRAMAANPIGYLIPCHRVIRATGAVGDYRWGSPRKTALLALEGARPSARARA